MTIVNKIAMRDMILMQHSHAALTIVGRWGWLAGYTLKTVIASSEKF